ncbi:uncharacterized protein LOC110862810 [Folsomia candida]|uniref:uncharacterized protein LOC110862810 n=1 Tax=Folsomia candida TaxID=158441 RepID=UPI001604B4E7|nr:uncharacterized protein LOC110862810 [Folsomia candida]
MRKYLKKKALTHQKTAGVASATGRKNEKVLQPNKTKNKGGGGGGGGVSGGDLVADTSSGTDGVENSDLSIQDDRAIKGACEKLCICVDWKLVESHGARVSASKSRIKIDRDALRWTPLVYKQYYDDEEAAGRSRDGSPDSGDRTTSPIRKTSLAAAMSTPDKNLKSPVVLGRRARVAANAYKIKKEKKKSVRRVIELTPPRKNGKSALSVPTAKSPLAVVTPKPSHKKTTVVIQPEIETPKVVPVEDKKKKKSQKEGIGSHSSTSCGRRSRGGR